MGLQGGVRMRGLVEMSLGERSVALAKGSAGVGKDVEVWCDARGRLMGLLGLLGLLKDG